MYVSRGLIVNGMYIHVASVTCWYFLGVRRMTYVHISYGQFRIAI